MGSRPGETLVATLVFPAEFPSSYLHFTTPRSPGIEAVELGIGTTVWHPSWVVRTPNGEVDSSCS